MSNRTVLISGAGIAGPTLAYWLAIPEGLRSNGVFLSIVIAECAIALASVILFRRGRWKTRQI